MRTLKLLFYFSVIMLFSSCNSFQKGGEEHNTDTLAFTGDSLLKVTGVIGGVSWASSDVYYRRLNEIIRDRYGSLYSANVLMYSIPFQSFAAQERLAEEGDWDMMTTTMVSAAQRLKAGGADYIIVASNTLNSLDSVIQARTGIPVLNIIDVVGKEIKRKGIKRVALLGTKYTMENDFYRGKLEQDYGLTVIVPDAKERDYINNVIFDELCNDSITSASKEGYKKIINRLVEQEDVKGVILGCTEIPLLIDQKDVDIPVFNSTELHVQAAVDYAVIK